MAEHSLKDRTVRGVGWSAIDNMAQYLVSFLVSIVLARLLSPDDYGLIGLTAIFITVCNTLINGGFRNALIRKKEVSIDDYDTVYSVNLGMSLFLYVVIFFCSPLIARFFGREELVLLTRVSSLGMIIGSFSLVQQVKLTRRLDFKSQAKITFIASIVSGIIGIVMALMGCGVWSLVVYSLSSQLLRSLLLIYFNKWFPRHTFSKRSFIELFGFGWKLMVSGLLDTLWKELSQVVVGKFYNSSTLGQYTRAKGFASLFSDNLTGVVQRVTFPVLSSIQDDNSRLYFAYRRIIRTTMFISAIGLFSLGAVSEPLLYCLIGPKWNEAAKYLPLICVSMSLYPLHAINLNMLQVQGRSDLFLGLEIIKKIIAIGPLILGALVGIMPMLYAVILTDIISFFLNSYWSGKLIGYSSWMQLKDIAPSYAIAGVLALSLWFVKYLPFSYWIVLPLQFVIGAIVFLILCRLTKIKEYDDAKELIKPFVRNLKKR